MSLRSLSQEMSGFMPQTAKWVLWWGEFGISWRVGEIKWFRSWVFKYI